MANLKKYVFQWYWTWDWLNRKCKAWYFGPRLDWMNLVKEPKKGKKRNENKKKKTQK